MYLNKLVLRRELSVTLNIFHCQAIIQTMDQAQVINLRGLLRYI